MKNLLLASLFSLIFTPNLVAYAITGIQDDSSIVTMAIYFTDSLGCTSTFELTSTASIELIDVDNMQCNFAPNPMNENAELTFNNDQQEELTISVVNALGELVFETTTKNQSVSVEGNRFENGIYFFTVRSAGTTDSCSGKFAVTK